MPKAQRDIFRKLRLNVSQLQTVADRRFEDARYLARSGSNKYANGAMYLGGFVVECLLKALLLKKYPELTSPGTIPTQSGQWKQLISLVYRSHDLDEMLAKLPEVTHKLLAQGQEGGQRLVTSLKGVCERWSIYARYSPYQVDSQDAAQFLERIKELRPWLR